MNSRLIQCLGMGLAVLGLGLFSASCTNPTSSAKKREKSENASLHNQRFDGVTLRVVGLKYRVEEAVKVHAKTFEAITGGKIVFETVPINFQHF